MRVGILFTASCCFIAYMYNVLWFSFQTRRKIQRGFLNPRHIHDQVGWRSCDSSAHDIQSFISKTQLFDCVRSTIQCFIAKVYFCYYKRYNQSLCQVNSLYIVTVYLLRKIINLFLVKEETSRLKTLVPFMLIYLFCVCLANVSAVCTYGDKWSHFTFE